jgi:hypothetical protein
LGAFFNWPKNDASPLDLHQGAQCVPWREVDAGS